MEATWSCAWISPCLTYKQPVCFLPYVRLSFALKTAPCIENKDRTIISSMVRDEDAKGSADNVHKEKHMTFGSYPLPRPTLILEARARQVSNCARNTMKEARSPLTVPHCSSS